MQDKAVRQEKKHEGCAAVQYEHLISRLTTRDAKLSLDPSRD